jgi:taurine dioxygenase
VASYQTIEVAQLSPHVGAELRGIDIAAGVSDLQMDEIKQAYAKHGVIFFREQQISEEQHIAFANRWGAININRFFTPAGGYPQIAEVRKEADQTVNVGSTWHTDHSYDQVPAMGSVLYARDVPAVGGDTCFASMYAAFEALSDGLKQQLLTLSALHSSRHVFGAAAYAPGDDSLGRLGNSEGATQDAIHPVIIRHPLSGRPALYVNGDFTVKFDGWTKRESAPLLEFLYQHAVQDEFTCRFHWEPGSMAIWDNRATHHRALNDYQGHARLMHRITIEGELLPAAVAC